MTTTTEITRFLLACIGEDESAARYAQTREGPSNGLDGWGAWWLGHYQHYSRQDPARVLSACTVKRDLIEWALGVEDPRAMGDPQASSWPAGEEVLRIMATEFADRPGYDERWKP